MAYEKQINADVKFVDYGKLKEGHDKENTIVLKEKGNIEGLVTEIKDTDKNYKHTFKIKNKDITKEILFLGNKSLNRQMLGDGLKDEELEQFTPVRVGDKVRITFNGLYDTDKGNPGYDITVEIDR